MSENPLNKLHAAGQSVWLDYIDRAMLRDGALEKLIAADDLMGMTSNPTIFEKALAEGQVYDGQIENDADGRTAWELFELIESDDVRAACDIFAGVYRATKGADGYVSIEVSPGVAHDADATVAEAHRLWTTVARPNVMVKVPGTVEGAKALKQLIADGINVNVTLLFSVEAHARIIAAYLEGLERRAAAGQPIDAIASVASFFVSRVDSEVDKRLDALIAQGGNAERLTRLKGKAAIANAMLAYRLFREQFSGDRWNLLAAQGARVQRPLWASTGTKNPSYRDVMYVEGLIGDDTVNTLPPATLDAFRDHGVVKRTVDANVDEADRAMAELAAVGIDFQAVTDKLLVDGLASFQKSFETLTAGLQRKTQALGRTLVQAR